MAFSALVLAAAMTLTPSSALHQARAILRFGLGDNSDVQFRGVELKTIGPDMMFCGQVNTRTDNGALTGWRDLLIMVSGDPSGPRSVVTGGLPAERSLIQDNCGKGERVDRRDYSAALDPHY